MRKVKFSCVNILKSELGSVGTLAVSAFFFLTGISAGIFLELFMSSPQKSGVAQYLLEYLASETTEMSYPNPFFSSLAINLLLLFVIFVSGLSVYGFPLVFLTLLHKGFSLGFSSCLIIEELHFKGVSLILFTVIPQNILLIPALLVASAGCADYALTSLSARRSGPYPQRNKKRQISKSAYCMFFILPTAAVLLGCVIEGLIFSAAFSP